MITEDPPSFILDELRDLVEDGLAPYRRLLPAPALRHFREATLFLLEVHPAALQWQAVLRSTWMARRAAAPADRPRPDDEVAENRTILDFVAERSAQAEHEAELVAYEAEAGLRYLAEIPFPPAETPAEGERALRRLVDLALAALFSAAIGAIVLRSYEPDGLSKSQLAQSFVSAWVLFARVGPQDKDALIFTAYFTYKHSVEADAKRHGCSVAEEQQDILSFLERFSRTIKADVPRLEHDVEAVLAQQTTPAAPSRPSVPRGSRPRRAGSRRQRS